MNGYCALAAEPKHSHFKGGIDVSSVIPHSIPGTSFLEAPLLVGDTAKVVSSSATTNVLAVFPPDWRMLKRSIDAFRFLVQS